MYIKDKDKYLHGLNPDYVLKDNDLSKIEQRSEYYSAMINKERSAINLPTIEEQEFPHIADIVFEEQLAMAYAEYGHLLDSQRTFSQWNKSFLKKTPCINRLIARY